MNKSSRSVMTFKGGIHPSGDGKRLSRNSSVQIPPLLEKYTVLLSENAGKPPKAVVKVGDKVIIGKYSGTEVKMDNTEYTIVRQAEILAIVE